MKRPAFQFYPADWRKDAELQSCSVTARGLWHEAMCIMHECEPYGELRVNGHPMAIGQLARLVGMTERECKKAWAELEAAGVCSKTEDGAFYSRRMVRDEKTRNARAEGGKSGAEHGEKGATHGSKGGRPREARGGLKPPLHPPINPPPSSSTSSSSSSSVQEDTALRSVTPPKLAIEIPDWIPPDAWAGFVEMRKKIRAPLTERGVLLTISALRKLRATEDIGAVLDQSTMKNYRGVFPVKHEGNGNGSRRKNTGHDNFFAASASLIRDLLDDGGQAESGDDCAAALTVGRPLLPS